MQIDAKSEISSLILDVNKIKRLIDEIVQKLDSNKLRGIGLYANQLAEINGSLEAWQCRTTAFLKTQE